jgi:hypothetical protein
MTISITSLSSLRIQRSDEIEHSRRWVIDGLWRFLDSSFNQEENLDNRKEKLKLSAGGNEYCP